MSITVYGTSDDRIEVDGDVSDTFGYTGDHGEGDLGDLLAFSDGTVLQIRRHPEYRWAIDVLARGASHVETWTHAVDGDQARVEDAVWVVHGIGWAAR